MMEMVIVSQDRLTDEQDRDIHEGFAQDALLKGVFSQRFDGVLVAKEEVSGKDAGFLVWGSQYGRMNIAVVLVKEWYRGKAVGNALLKAAEALARQEGLLAMYLSTMDHQAQPFYEKAGFVVVGRLESIGGFPGRVWLEKRL